MYTCIAGKGKISCYFFGIISSICYSLLAFKNALWGNLALNLFYYLPMQVVGVFNWKKHLKKDTKEIIKTSLDKKDLFKLIIISVLSCVLGIAILSVLGDKNPVFDGITTVLSIFGMYLTVKRCIEQWFVWMIVNGLSVLMWIDLVLKGSKTFAAVIVWSVYFILALYFFWVWKKEMSLSCSGKSEKVL